MSEHKLVRELWLPQPPAEVFDFFSAARNLEQITPPFLNFRVLTPEPIEMCEGALIRYRLKIRGVPAGWLTRIARWNPPHEFIDMQLKGPYKLWHHRHRFIAQSGGTRMIDEVTYELPFGPLGDVAHRLMVRSDVEAIFDYRNQWIANHFGNASDNAADRARQGAHQ